MYQWNAREYQASSSNQKKWAMELLSKLDLEGDERVLDIGCGDGEITALIARRVPHGFVVGIDSSRDMIELAIKRCPSERCPNLTFFLKDAGAMDFDEEFDAVFSNACLHWIIDHKSVLEGIKRCLKPSGKVLLQMGGLGNAKTVLEALDDIIKESQWAKFFEGFVFPYGFYGSEEYRNWLGALGFKIVRVGLLPKDMVHEGKGQFAAWLRTTWLPYTQRVPETLREEFIAAVVEQYAGKYSLGNDGHIHIRMVRLEVEAEKGTA